MTAGLPIRPAPAAFRISIARPILLHPSLFTVFRVVPTLVSHEKDSQYTRVSSLAGMEVEPSTWYSSRVTLPSHDIAHWRLTSQPCLCSNHHSTWAPPSPSPISRSLSRYLFYFSTPLYLPLSFPLSPSSLSLPSLWTFPLNLHPSLYLSASPLYLPLSLNLSPPSLDLSPPPSISIDRNLPISQQLSYLPLSISLPLPPWSISPLSRPPLLLSLWSLHAFLSLDTSLPPSSLDLSPLSFPPLFPSSPYRSIHLYLSTHLYLPLPLPPSPPLSSTLYISPLHLFPLRPLPPLLSSIWISLDLYRYLAISRHLFISRYLPLSNSPFLWNPLSVSPPLSIPISQHLSISLDPPLYISLSVPSRSFSWSLSIDASLDTSNPFFSISTYIFRSLSLPSLSIFPPLYPSPSISLPPFSISPPSLERYPSICRHLSISICLPPSRSLPFALSLPPISISPLTYDLYRYLYFSTPLYIHISPLAGYLSPLSIPFYLSLWSISLSINVSISL